jgi:hypothetical protein
MMITNVAVPTRIELPQDREKTLSTLWYYVERNTFSPPKGSEVLLPALELLPQLGWTNVRSPDDAFQHVTGNNGTWYIDVLYLPISGPPGFFEDHYRMVIFSGDGTADDASAQASYIAGILTREGA